MVVSSITFDNALTQLTDSGCVNKKLIVPDDTSGERKSDADAFFLVFHINKTAVQPFSL